MFTLEQIKAAHSQVKSGADFPAYVQELISLGVASYIVEVQNGITIYRDQNNTTLSGTPKYETLEINQVLDLEGFKSKLKAHQNGETDYMTFCRDCASNGIYGWKLEFDKMTCSYINKDYEIVLVEQIPQ